MPPGAWSDLADAAVDLLLGGRCAGCGRAGRVLCAACASGLPVGAVAAWPDPAPPGLVPPFAAGEYADVVRSLIVGHKERGLLGLRAPLAGLLAHAVRAAVEDQPSGPLVLAPVPSRPGTARTRGHDPTLRLTTRAARMLRADGVDAVAFPLLRSRPGVVDQAGLDAVARAANLAGSMHCPTERLRALAARRPHARVVVCDDVVTTGATLREAQRALEAVGLEVIAVAAVAATRRRIPPSGPAALSPVGPTV